MKKPNNSKLEINIVKKPFLIVCLWSYPVQIKGFKICIYFKIFETEKNLNIKIFELNLSVLS